MKNSKITKILIFTLTVALLAVTAFAFSVSAEETAQTDPELEIAGKNIVYGDTFTIQYAVSTSKITADAELVIGNSAGVLGSAKFSKTETTDKITGTEDTYYVFEVTGIPASDVCEDIIVHVEDGDKVGPELKYSLGEYFYERLYADGIINATEGKALYQKALYLNFLSYAASAQDLFKNYENGEDITLVTDYCCAYAQDGTIDGIDSFKFSKETFTVTLNFTGTVPTGNVFDTWIATTDGATTKVANGATVTITGSTVFTPSFKIKNNNNTLIAGATFDNVTTLKGDGTDRVGIKFSYGIGNIETAGQINAGDEIKITQDPADENNKVLMFKDGSSSNCSTLFIQASSDYHGVARNGISVFETKIYIPASEILTTGVLAQPQFNQGGRSLAHTMNLVVDDDKTYVGFALSNTDGQETSDKITLDAWHALRLEFYNYSSTELGTPIIKVYIDNLYAGYIESTNVKDISGFMWKGLSDAKCTIYFDNMSFSEKAMPTN